MIKYLFKQKWMVLGLFAGSLSGYLYYYFIGCESGACAISSNPWISTLYGALMGGIMGYRAKG